MNIIFTAAGKGTRFHGHNKPFYIVKGKTLLQWSVGSLGLNGVYWVIGNNNSANEIEHITWDLGIRCNYNFVGDTRGQAETALDTAKLFNQDEPLIITNCDQYLPWDTKRFNNFIDNNDFDGIVTTFDHSDVTVGQPSKYSHILLQDGVGVELAEKFAISADSLNGIFYYRKARFFVEAAQELMQDDSPNEKYMSLTYNFMIKKGLRVGAYKMEPHEFVSLGSLEEIEKNLGKLPESV